MQRNFILPSETGYRFDHDCRADTTKFKSRSMLFDVSIFSTLMSRTKSSLNLFYDKSLYQPEVLDASLQSSSSFVSNKSKSKCLKDLVLNDGKASYGECIWSNGIASTSNGDIFLVDRIEHRVLVFNKEFIYKYQIGSRGSASGQFDEPSDICISESGKLYVADTNNSRVQIFSVSKRNRGQEPKVKVSTSFSFGFEGLDDLFSASPTKSAKSYTSSKTKMFKTTGEFCYHNCIDLDDKPVKLCSSAFSGNMAVSTKNGLIFVFNEFNEILSYLKLRKPTELSNITNICLDEFGETLTCFRHNTLDQKITIKNYSVQPKLKAKSANSSVFTIASYGKKEPHKMSMTDSHELETNYFPGIKLIKIGNVKLAMDSKHYIIYDALNLNLLEYDLEGKFKRVVLKAEEHLGNVLAFDFAGDHIITSEVIFNKRSLLEVQRAKAKSQMNLRLGVKLNDGLSSRAEENAKNISKAHVFKLKLFKYMDCPCHKNMETTMNLNEFSKTTKSATFQKSLSFLENDDFDFMKSQQF